MHKKDTVTSIITQINSVADLLKHPKKLTAIKKKTAAFLKAIKWKPGQKICVDNIPFDILIYDEYQNLRVEKAETQGEINNLLSEWDNDQDMPCLINCRTSGQFAGLLFIVDGYHRIRTKEIMSAKNPSIEGAWAVIKSMDADKEILVFANQDINVKAVPTIVKYEAWLTSNSEEDENVLAAKNIRATMNKYHADAAIYGRKTKFCKLGLRQALNICLRSQHTHKNDIFDWIIHVLIESGFAVQNRGLAADTLLVMERLYYMTCEGKFSNSTIDDVGNALIRILKDYTWNGLERAGSTRLQETSAQTIHTDRRSVVTYFLTQCICLDLNIPC